MRRNEPGRHKEPDQLIQGLTNWNRFVGEEAEDKLRELGPAATDHLIALLKHSARPWRVIIFRTLYLIAAFGGLALIFGWLWHKDPVQLLQDQIGIAVGSLIMLAVNLRAGRSRSAKLLAELEDPRAAGVLLEALPHLDSRVYSRARLALISILPKLTPDYRESFTAVQREALNRLLQKGDRNLTVSALVAIRHVGGADSVPRVELLANGGGIARKDLKVRDLAERVLSQLRSRIDEEQNRELLLRASSGSASDSTLLQPAGDTAAAKSELLLRASSDQGSN